MHDTKWLSLYHIKFCGVQGTTRVNRLLEVNRIITQGAQWSCHTNVDGQQKYHRTKLFTQQDLPAFREPIILIQGQLGAVTFVSPAPATPSPTGGCPVMITQVKGGSSQSCGPGCIHSWHRVKLREAVAQKDRTAEGSGTAWQDSSTTVKRLSKPINQ